jgi:carboxylesterase
MTAKDYSIRISAGPTGVLLLHGLSGTPVEMAFVAKGLARLGYTVHCPQLAGHCGTVNDLKAARWQDWRASAEASLSTLSKSCNVVIVGGLSTGAIMSLDLAARHPTVVNGTILYAPTLWLNGWIVPWYARLFRLVLQKPIANLFSFPDIPPHGIKDERIRERVRVAMQSGDSSRAGLPVTPGGAVLEHRWLVDTVRKQLQTIWQPALIIYPREDDYADLNNITYLQRHLPGMLDIVALNDCYHVITVDRQSNIVIERTAHFIERICRQVRQQAAAPQEQVRKRANLRR